MTDDTPTNFYDSNFFIGGVIAVTIMTIVVSMFITINELAPDYKHPYAATATLCNAEIEEIDVASLTSMLLHEKHISYSVDIGNCNFTTNESGVLELAANTKY